MLRALGEKSTKLMMAGYFNEGNASPDNNYLKRIEAKKLLSTIEKSGLLSKADKAGLTLSRVCQGV